MFLKNNGKTKANRKKLRNNKYTWGKKFEEKPQTNTNTSAPTNSAKTDCINTGRYTNTQNIEMEILKQKRKKSFDFK